MRALIAVLFVAQSALAQENNFDSVRVRFGAPQYPRSAIDSQGGVVILKSPPRRIVSLALNTDEYLYQVVPPEFVVGVSRFAYNVTFSAVLDHVDKYKPQIASDKDAILAANPDLVIGTDSVPMELVEALTAAGIPVFRMWTLTNNLEQVADNITVVGYLTGQDESARKERARFEREIMEIEAQCRPAKNPPARIYGVSMQEFGFGDHTLFQDVIRRIGAVNVAAEGGLHAYEPVTHEQIVSFDPGWVFTWSAPGTENHQKELRRWVDDPVLGKMAAVKTNRVIVSDGKDIFLLSPRVTTLAHILADATCPAPQ